MRKRMLAGVIAVVLTVGLLPAAMAAAPADGEAAQVLSALNIMVGDQNGELHLERTVTRAEFTRMVIAASPWRDSAGDAASVAPYPDVPRTHWAAPYIQAAVSGEYISGYLDGTFRPDNTITLAEGVTMVLRLLGYQPSDFTGAYPAGQMAAYRNLELDEGVTAAQNDAMTRRDALYLFYNLMTTKNKTGVYHLNTLEPTLNLVGMDGTLDRVALVNSAMEGPVVAEGSWQGKVPFDLSSAAVYRDGKSAPAQAIQALDVVYWSKPMRSVWAYSRRATGTLEQVSPSASAPASVTVAGRTYAIESGDAAYALSDLGEFRVGDSVTLLLGRGGGVAAVRSAGEALEGSTVYGMVTSVQNTGYTDNRGDTYTSRSVTVYTTSGAVNTYPTDESYFKAGDLVRITTEGGAIQVKRLSASTLSGKVSADGTKLGSYVLADDVEILDTYEDTAAVRVYPSRLAGVRLTESMVRFYATNAQGEIQRLILKDATGDLHTYGVLTIVTEISAGMTTMSSYVADIGGQAVPMGSQTTVFGVKKGPCQIKGSLQAPDRISNLTEVKLDSVTGNTALSSANRSYPVSERAAVYEVRDGKYYLSSLTRVSGGDYTLAGYYDKEPEQGGQIRVIVAR